ncbi:DedA family protein [Nibrella saemangeumensis]|uniref:DedA family protein n=1 Tax=Nibrella saemangeumensis TaxID=1084526 RepID=A0ABP8NGK7_9BACT
MYEVLSPLFILSAFEVWLQQYGYVAVLIGSVLEGETALLSAAFAANRGYLSLPFVIGAAFVGSTLTSYTYFWLGRSAGQRWLAKRPALLRRAERVHRLIERNPSGILVVYHFMYGLRALIPLVYGMSKVSSGRYLLLASVSTTLWAVGIGMAGYHFGEVVTQHFEVIKKHAGFILLGLVVVALLIGLSIRYKLLTWLKSRFSVRSVQP